MNSYQGESGGGRRGRTPRDAFAGGLRKQGSGPDAICCTASRWSRRSSRRRIFGGPVCRQAESHAGFVQFLRFSGADSPSRPRADCNLFSLRDSRTSKTGFRRPPDRLRSGTPRAHLANDGPDPEYPWPHVQPHTSPVDHRFAVWASLTSGQGRDLMRVVHIAVNRFSQYADT